MMTLLVHSLTDSKNGYRPSFEAWENIKTKSQKVKSEIEWNTMPELNEIYNKGLINQEPNK